MTKAAIFKRVSTDMTKQDITNQDADTNKVVADNTLDVVKRFNVEASAYHGDHEPELQQILTDVRNGLYTVVVVAMTSRISRMGHKHALRFVWDLADAGGRVMAADNPMFGKGDLIGDISTMFAANGDHEYSKKISENVTRSHANIKAKGYWIGSVPFGYQTQGDKGRKSLVHDPVEAPITLEAFTRVSNGQSAASVGAWLDTVAPQIIKKTGKRSPWRARRVIQMIKNPVYKGEHATHTGYAPIVDAEVWASANAALSARSFETGGRRGVHGYSGVVFCACGETMYHHQSSKNGKAVGEAHYRCARGRRGIGSETKCGNPGILFEAANAAIDAEMLSDFRDEWVMVTTGGDAERQAQITALESKEAMARKGKDRKLQREILDQIDELEAMPATPVITKPRRTGRTINDVWAEGTIQDRRAFLKGRTGTESLVVTVGPDGIQVWTDDSTAEQALAA